jgi:hypothetical protein
VKLGLFIMRKLIYAGGVGEWGAEGGTGTKAVEVEAYCGKLLLTKARLMRWEGHVTHKVEKSNSRRVLLGST